MPGMLFSDSYINEWGISIASDNCPSREDKPEITDGGIGYMLRALVAQRARTSREGVLLAGRLVERFGYIDSGRTYIICDPDEGWLFCVVNGKHWLAKRVADDGIAMVANTYTVREVDISDRENVLASDDIVDYAKARGWYDPRQDGTFDFAEVYASPGSAVHPSNLNRQRSGLDYVTAEPIPSGAELPFSVVPRCKVTAATLMQVLRHDNKSKQTGSSEGPEEGFCRICSGSTQTSFVAQLRRGMPADIGIVYWVTLAPPRTSVYIPFYFAISDFPDGYRSISKRPSMDFFSNKVSRPFKADPREAFWTFSNFRDKVAAAPEKIIAKVIDHAERIERHTLARQKSFEKAVRREHNKDKAKAAQLLTDHSRRIYLSSLETMENIISHSTDSELRMKARELAQKHLIIDTHQDVPYRLRKKMENISQLTTGGNFDYPRAREGGLDALFMAVFIPHEYEEKGGAFGLAEEQIDMVEGFARDWPDKFVMARSAADVKKQFGDSRISIAVGIENGAPIEGKLANVKYFYDRGVRYITLTHSECNHICDSSFDEQRKWNGLSPFGRELVLEMNRRGMIVDVSHVSDEAFYQILGVSKAPVVATHSSCRHFTPGWERNMDDEMIKLLAQKGGVIQITFGSMFVNERVNKELPTRWKHIREYARAHDLQGDEKDQYAEAYLKDNPYSDADVSDVAAHIDHAVKLVGIDHVGLGSDFDGVGDNLPNGLKDVSCYPNLIYELLKMGYSERDISKICSGNFLRVWSQVEQIGAEL
jgi:membrane dipeptidase